MTISLLRRIWQRIHVERMSAPRQRLTGFEPLEPRMVLSGFSAFFAPDYFSPPPGDYSHIDRSGAEIARPGSDVGAYSDYNGMGRGVGRALQDFGSIQTEPLATAFDRPSSGDWLFARREGDDLASPLCCGRSSIGEPISGSLTPYTSPLSSADTTVEGEYEIGDGSSLEKVDIVNVTITPETSLSYITISPIAVDRILAVTSSISFAAFSPGLTSTLSTMSSSFRSLTDRDYTPVSSGGAVEQHAEEHAYVAPSHGSQSDASLALAARPTPATERSTANAALNAALANQAGGPVNPVTDPTADGSSVQGQANIQSNSATDHQQNGLLELTDAERLKLKRKLPGSTAETEEATSSRASRSERYDDIDVQIAYDATRPFSAGVVSEGALLPIAAENLADDGMMEVLAADVTAVIARGEVIDQVAANRQVGMEPAVATYQAFDVVADGDDSAAAEVAADAARLAAAVAMNGQPMVQAE